MRRYFVLYLYFLRFSFSKAMEFRVDFSFRIVMDIIYYVVNILFFKVIYLHTPMLAGWTEEQTMVFVATYLTIDALSMTIFSTNMWWLPFYINKGDLDFYLIRPVNPLFFLSLREFSANSFVNLLIALGFLTYTLVTYPAMFSAGELFFYFVLVINGLLLMYCLQMLMIIPVFWTQSTRGFIDLFHSMSHVMERPDRIFRGWLRVVFTFALPFALIASFPARIFLEGASLQIILHLVAVTIIMWSLMLFCWKHGLKNYSSASS